MDFSITKISIINLVEKYAFLTNLNFKQETFIVEGEGFVRNLFRALPVVNKNCFGANNRHKCCSI